MFKFIIGIVPFLALVVVACNSISNSGSNINGAFHEVRTTALQYTWTGTTVQQKGQSQTLDIDSLVRADIYFFIVDSLIINNSNQFLMKYSRCYSFGDLSTNGLTQFSKGAIQDNAMYMDSTAKFSGPPFYFVNNDSTENKIVYQLLKDSLYLSFYYAAIKVTTHTAPWEGFTKTNYLSGNISIDSLNLFINSFVATRGYADTTRYLWYNVDVVKYNIALSRISN